MHLRFSAFVLSTVLALAGCAGGSQPQGSAPPLTVTITETPTPPTAAPAPPAAFTPIIGSVLAPPVPVPATDGKTHLAYELVLSNTLPQDVTLTSLAVKAGDATLLTLTGADLTDRTRISGSTLTTTIGPAQTALVWLDVALAEGTSVPADISHTVGITVPQPQPPLTEQTMTENIAATTVDSRKPVTLTPPLRGDNWLDGDSVAR